MNNEIESVLNTFNTPDLHLKGWGYEVWIANSEKYCGKLLHFNKGKRCSWHYHNMKDETFYVYSGKLVVTYSFEDNRKTAESILLSAGDKFHVPVGMRHQMKALKDTDMFEFSTQHFEFDSIRLERGSKSADGTFLKPEKYGDTWA